MNPSSIEKFCQVTLAISSCISSVGHAADLTSTVALLGNPTEGSNLSGRNQSVWDLQFFDGRIYMGSGNTTTNPGTNKLWSYNPDGLDFTSELTAASEAIEVFRVYDGRIYIPASDPTSGDSLKYYYRDVGAPWQAVSSTPALAHVRDVIPVSGGKLLGVGNARTPESVSGAVTSSLEGAGMKQVGISAGDGNVQYTDNFFYSVIKYKNTVITTNGYFGYQLHEEFIPGPNFGVNGNYTDYSFGFSLEGIGSYNTATEKIEIDRRVDFTDSDNFLSNRDFLPATIPSFSAPSAGGEDFLYFFRIAGHGVVDSRIVYALRAYSLSDPQYTTDYMNGHGLYVKTKLQGRPQLIVFPGKPNAIGEDVIILDNTDFYAVGNECLSNGTFEVSVHRSATPENLLSWESIFTFNSPARVKSIEYSRNRFYFGLGFDSGDTPANATASGRLLAVSYALHPFVSTLAPTSIAFTPVPVFESAASGSLVGRLSTIDADINDNHVYSLVGGDTAKFQIVGNRLLSFGTFDASVKNNYTVAIRSTDVAGRFTEKNFTITVLPSTKRASDGSLIFGSDDSLYDSGQDGAGGKPTAITISADKRLATITGNVWKKFPLIYTVTANTILEFTVNSSDTGELIGVSLDNDNIATNTDSSSSKRGFVVGGSDVSTLSWANHVTPTYVKNTPAQTYLIPVGTFFTGAVTNLGLIGDDDADGSTKITFGNIRLFEAGTPEGYATISGRFDWGSTPVADRDPDDDANRNGVNNLMEFAFNISPTAPGIPTTLTPGTGTSGLPAVSVITPATPTLRIEYLRRKTSGLTYKVKFSNDLITWEDAIANPTPTSINTDWERMIMPDTAGSGRKKRFAMVEVKE